MKLPLHGSSMVIFVSISLIVFHKRGSRHLNKNEFESGEFALAFKDNHEFKMHAVRSDLHFKCSIPNQQNLFKVIACKKIIIVQNCNSSMS